MAQGSFVNVTSAPYGKATRGDDTSLNLKEYVPPYGRVPVAVSEICHLTYFCPRAEGCLLWVHVMEEVCGPYWQGHC